MGGGVGCWELGGGDGGLGVGCWVLGAAAATLDRRVGVGCRTSASHADRRGLGVYVEEATALSRARCQSLQPNTHVRACERARLGTHTLMPSVCVGSTGVVM